MQATNRIKQWIPQQAADAACATIEHHPLATTFTMFGIGIGVGVAVGILLADTVLAPAHPPTLSGRTWDAMSQYLPESVMRTIRS
jgi:hypothetical protein